MATSNTLCTLADELTREIVDVVLGRLDIPPFDEDWPALVRAVSGLPGAWHQIRFFEGRALFS